MNIATSPELQIGAPARFTVEEFMQLVDTAVFEGSKVELVEGVIVRMAPAMSQHMHYKRLVAELLREAFAGGEPRREVHTELTLRLGPATLRDADVGVIAPFPIDVGFPDSSTALLVVEIAVTSLDYDLNEKQRDYARASIPHYWVVDVPKRRTYVMSTPLDADYAERHPVAFGAPLAVPDTERSIVID